MLPAAEGDEGDAALQGGGRGGASSRRQESQARADHADHASEPLRLVRLRARAHFLPLPACRKFPH